MPNIQDWLHRVDEAKRELKRYPPLSEGAIYRFRQEFRVLHTYDSNAIEGSQLSLRETVLLLNDGLTVAGRPISHAMATLGYAMGIDAIFDETNANVQLSEELIKDFHKFVLLGMNPKHCGIYRNTEVQIAGSSTQRPDFGLVPYLIRELVQWWEKDAKLLHPVEAIAQFHCRYEDIHPFIDGNGRSGRLLLNYQLVRAGYWPVNIRYAEERLRYYDAFEAWDTKKDLTPMVALIAEREIAQLKQCTEIAVAQEQYAQTQSN